MLKGLVAVAFVSVLGWASTADAGSRPSPYIVIDRGGLEVFRERRVTVKTNPTCHDHAGKHVCGGADPDRRLHRHRPHHLHLHVVPTPIYVAPRVSCYVPGYWTTQWVPQQSLYTVWVDGYRAADGTWITGHFEQRAYVSGYSQQTLWVPERWGC
jgi:hypothetical protein